ncbi:uncharacterized protein LOC141768407 [Sebastes fasciatus]|uniref:uncharacterized protein LOC141768407 n=1 Tax=Sebastes fasciatus TaxID=394691 RepID=UPI003D9DD280
MQGRGFLIRHLVSHSTLHSAPVNNHLINPQYKNTSFPANPRQIVLPTSCASLPSSHPHAASAHSSSHSTLLSSLPVPCLLQRPHHLYYNKSTCFSTTIQLCLCLHLGPNQQPSQNNLATMDPADTDSLRQALASQGALVGQHDKVLHELVENLRALSSNVIRLGSQMDQVNAHLTASYASSATAASPADPPPALPTPPPGHATLAREPFIPTPERYSGDLGAYGRFLLQCSLVFQQQPTTYLSDKSRTIVFVNAVGREPAAHMPPLLHSCPNLPPG